MGANVFVGSTQGFFGQDAKVGHASAPRTRLKGVVWISSFCLFECRALKSERPSMPSLAIDHELPRPPFQSGLNDPGETLCPIVAVLRNQPHAVAVALQAEAVTVILISWNHSGAAETVLPMVGRQSSNRMRRSYVRLKNETRP